MLKTFKNRFFPFTTIQITNSVCMHMHIAYRIFFIFFCNDVIFLSTFDLKSSIKKQNMLWLIIFYYYVHRIFHSLNLNLKYTQSIHHKFIEVRIILTSVFVCVCMCAVLFQFSFTFVRSLSSFLMTGAYASQFRKICIVLIFLSF